MSDADDWTAGRRALIAAYDEHHAAIGRIAHGWAELHENLCALFIGVTGFEITMGCAVWFAIQNDRSQRDMIVAALNAPVDPLFWRARPRLREDANWLLGKVRDIADPRNNAVHTSFMMSFIGSEEAPLFRPSPDDFYGNPRARKLRSKGDIAGEFAWANVRIRLLSSFTSEMAAALRDAEHPWPDKPRLPPRPA